MKILVEALSSSARARVAPAPKATALKRATLRPAVELAHPQLSGSK